MRSTLTRTELRRLQIIESLNFSQVEVSEADLLNTFKCSDRTLEKEIRNINKAFDFLKIEKNKYLSIKFKDNTSIRNVYQEILQNKLDFQIVEYIFYHGYTSIKNLEKKFYNSQSTLYRMISKFNKACLNRYQVKIRTYPCSFFGNERNIRYFLTHYFTEAYGEFKWPIKNLDEEMVDEFLKFIVDSFSININYSEYRFAKIYLSVSLIRTSMNKLDTLYDVDEKIDMTYNQIKSDSNFINSIEKFEKIFEIKLDKNCLAQLFAPIAQKKFIYTYDELKENSNGDLKLAESLKYIENAVDDLANEFELKVNNKNELVMNLYNATNAERYNIYDNFILFDEISIFLNFAKENYGNFFERLSKKVEEFCELLEKPKDKHYQNYLIYNAITVWDKLIIQLQSKYRNVKILIVSKRGPEHADIYRQKIISEMKESIDISLYDNPILNKDMIKAYNCDLVISDIPIPNFDDDIIYVEVYPKLQDMMEVASAIVKVNPKN